MFWIWKDRVIELEKKIATSEQDIRSATSQAQLFFNHGKHYARQLNDFFAPSLLLNAQETEAFLSEEFIPCVRGWEENHWKPWQPGEALLENVIRIGEYTESRGDRSNAFKIPHYAPFIGSSTTLIIISDDNTADQAIGLLQSLAIRTATTLPHQSQYTLIDPVGSGAAFPMQRYLPFVRETGDDIRRDLDQVSKDIQRIIATYLDAGSDSFELLDPDVRINQRLEIILAANFPKRYDRRAIEALQNIGNTGPKAGKYLILHYNQSQDLPRDMSMRDFENAVYIDLTNGYGKNQSNACKLSFRPDIAPSPSLQKEIFDKLGKAKPPQRNLDWDKNCGIPESEWWTKTSAKIIETPIGGYGSSELLKIWFGENGDKRVCAHGMMGAMTGAGKSTLYHVLIMGLATRYSPEEIKFYLIDGKQGVEFQPYRDLPHAEVVSLHSPPELSRSVLAELLVEMEYRYTLFSEPDIRVQDLAGYYEKKQPRGKLPRILLLVDEYQELFEGDQDGIASSYLLKLSQQGRAAGIHMLLASQKFGAAGMLNRDAIFGNFHLLMAMQMRHDDIQSLTGFGRRGKQYIMTCDLPGKIVVNDDLGNDGSNKLGKVAFLSSNDRDKLIQKLNCKAHEQFSADELPLRAVLDGKEQPNIVENPHFRKLLENSNWLTAQEWQAKARQAVHLGGLGVTDWFSADRPRVMWLGQEFSVRGQALIVMRRRMAENAVIIGSENTARYGMLAGILSSLAISNSPIDSKFYIFDRSMSETQWCKTLHSISDSVLRPSGFSVEFTRNSKDVSPLIESLITEIERRTNLEDDERIAEPSIFVVMTELDQVDDIRRQNDSYGMVDSPLGEKFRRLYVDGSRLGLHLILSFSGLRAMLNVIDDRRDLINFRHRVGLQMSEDESFTFVRNRLASRLQLDGNKPISALYLDVESDRTVRFKPYSTESIIPLDEQLTEISSVLNQWRKTNEHE
jgi:DNA segregation ATPase FtsK/SpoIIIE, S-DNA-T family